MKRALSPSAAHDGENKIVVTKKHIGKQCQAVGCATRPVFGLPGDKGTRCKLHRATGMVDVVNRLCSETGCVKQCSYGRPGGKPERCSDHRRVGTIRLNRRRCMSTGCDKHPSFGLPGAKPICCGEHRHEGMIDVQSSRCSGIGCDIRNPAFGVAGGRGLWCKTHKEPGMVNVRSKSCTMVGCVIKNPCFDLPGGTGLRCDKHKEPGMYNVKAKRCIMIGCDVAASLGLPDGKITWCALHCEAGAVCKTGTRCSAIGCNTRAVFGTSGGKAEWCASHRQAETVDCVNRRCLFTGCGVQPTYAMPGGRGEYCKRHCLVGMVDVRKVHCSTLGCNTRACYGVPGSRPILCAEHKTKLITAEDGTPLKVTNNPSKKCHCKQPATHGIRKPERCETHALQDDLNLVESPCAKCGLVFRLDPRTQQCAYCYADSVHKPKLAKQREVKQFLQHQCPDLPAWTSYDRAPQELKDCRDYERPDFMWADWDGDKAWSLVLEVDENQHETYPIWCECTRQVNITEDMGRYTLWIRYNPDSYKPARPGQRQVPQAERLAELARHIRGALATLPVEPNHSGAVLWLFFDGYDSEAPNVKWRYL